MIGNRGTSVAAFVLGVCVGALTVFGITRTDDLLDPSSSIKTDPGAARWQCSGAEVVVTAIYDEVQGQVELLVSLDDHKHRTWELKESPYYAGAVLTPTRNGTYPQLRLADGDLDGGASRQLSLRAADMPNWCEGRVSLR